METAAFTDVTPATAPDNADITSDAATHATSDDAMPDPRPATDDTVAPHRRYLCRHIFADGHRCGSPALRHEPFCYYHHVNRRPKPAAGKFRHVDAWEPFNLPIVEDRASALLVSSQILSRIASNDLDPTRAGHMIRGLQAIARFLPPEPRPATSPRPPVPAPAAPPDLVEDPILDETHGSIAPVAEYTAPESPAADNELPARTAPSRKPAAEPIPERPQKRLADFDTEEEKDYLAELMVMRRETGRHPRPASLSDQDIDDYLGGDGSLKFERRDLPAPESQPTPDPATFPTFGASHPSNLEPRTSNRLPA
ncbi:MAG: hypothetical protein ABSG84_17030 [Acidobacteriaceae bacterium]|jgi:hypothetical protein